MMILWYRLERAFHLTEAYLAEQRGEMNVAADCKCRAWECERQITRLEIQR